MSDKQTAMVCGTAVLIVALIIGGCAFYTQQFINGGYCETTLPGRSTTAWVKCAR